MTFDDVTERNRLEFGSIGAGILPTREFLSQQNLTSVRAAVTQFPASTRRAAMEPNGEFQNEEFRFIVPEYARRYFREEGGISVGIDRRLAQDAGSIHVTHTFDTTQNEGRSARFLLDCGAHKDSLLTMPTSVVGTCFSNSARTVNGPNTKTPTELLAVCSRGDYLYPMSNTVKGIREDIAVYDQVRRVITDRIAITDPGQGEFLQAAQNTLLRTREFVLARSQEAIQQAGRKGLLSSKMDDVYVFESYECNLQPSIHNIVLVEHRSPDDPIVHAVTNVVKAGLSYESQRPIIRKAVEILEEIAPRASQQRQMSGHAAAQAVVPQMLPVQNVAAPAVLENPLLAVHNPHVPEQQILAHEPAANIPVLQGHNPVPPPSRIPSPIEQYGTPRRDIYLAARIQAALENPPAPLPLPTRIPRPVEQHGKPRQHPM